MSAVTRTGKTPERLTSIDLFAGAGGLSTGLRAANFDVLGAVEIDPTAAATYRLNHPKAAVITADIRTLTGPKILNTLNLVRGELDLLSGCPPCQGFSELRTRRRTSPSRDERNDLLFEVLRLTRSMRPRALIVENVPGLARDERLARFSTGLSACGYNSDFAIVDARGFGVPQRRKRLVFIAIRADTIPDDWSRPTHTAHCTVRDAIGSLPAAGNSGDILHDLPENRSSQVMARIRATPKDGGSRKDLPERMACPCHRKSDGYSDVYGRMSWDQVSPTITSGCSNPSRGRFLHPHEDRAITLREAALLQTFPPEYRFSLSRGKEHAARQIGNAFPPRLIEPIARRLHRKLRTR